MIYIENKKRKLENVQKQYPDALIVDVTSKATDTLQKLSPFYPHYDIPIPFTEGMTAACVEGVWQGLKVFKGHDVDFRAFSNDSMKNLKRTVRKYGKPLGHRKGVYGTELLNYFDARVLIYIPTYKWVLEHKVQFIVTHLKEISRNGDIVLLDYNTNTDFWDTSKPLSHSGLVKLYIEGLYPEENTVYTSLREARKNDIEM